VSLGPGSSRYLAPQAREVLVRSEVIVGYDTYMGLLDPELVSGKEIVSTGMKREIDRCRAAIRKTLDGKRTAVVCSGDAGIYGMAGLVLELIEEDGLLGRVEVEVVPGIPALCAAAALLGAPLMHDFAVVSLSDLLTSWEVILARAEAAARADFVIVLYNPRSKKRNWQLGEIRKSVLRHRAPETPVGVVRNAMREGQEAGVTTLGDLDESRIDMFTILIIGNSQTRFLGEKMVTPRGYKEKYGGSRFQGSEVQG
jgi:precorrin-3B C17-methyltransferase